MIQKTKRIKIKNKIGQLHGRANNYSPLHCKQVYEIHEIQSRHLSQAFDQVKGF
jgi:hypothetical protein